MLALLLLAQDLDPEEVPVRRLFARPVCKPARGEIVVCGNQPGAYRVGRIPPRPDPMTVDRRPKVKLGGGLCLRVGFMVSVSRC